MATSARCCCPHTSEGVQCGCDRDCPIHGFSAPDPCIPWLLSVSDKNMLRTMRIDPIDADLIEQTPQADEDRWRRE